MMANGKTRETRLRRMADRQGLRLVKSRRRDPYALDFGKYMLVDALDAVVAGAGPAGDPSLTLDEVEAWLRGER